MTTQEIANRLVEICRAGQNPQAYDELFAENAIAIEPAHTQQPNAVGLDALKEKTKNFMNNVKEFHGSYVSDPIVAGKFFSCTMGMDITMQDGERTKMDEVCVYEVEDGKIVKEQFFF
jgi:ketosteroid isomerase-like protein